MVPHSIESASFAQVALGRAVGVVRSMAAGATRDGYQRAAARDDVARPGNRYARVRAGCCEGKVAAPRCRRGGRAGLEPGGDRQERQGARRAADGGVLFIRRSGRIQASTEDEVRHRQQSLQHLLDSAAEGLYGVDPSGNCTFINRAALAMLGYDRESQILGKNLNVLLHHTTADGSARSQSASLLVQPHRALHFSEEVLWRRDGTCFPIEMCPASTKMRMSTCFGTNGTCLDRRTEVNAYDSLMPRLTMTDFQRAISLRMKSRNAAGVEGAGVTPKPSKRACTVESARACLSS